MMLKQGRKRRRFPDQGKAAEGERIMQRRRWTHFAAACIGCLAVWLCLGCAPALAAKTPNLKNYKQALNYARQKQPDELKLSGVSFTPTQLLAIRSALPKEAAFSFSTTWNGCSFSNRTVNANFQNIRKTPTSAELEAVVKLCPNLKKISVYGNRSPGNKVMSALSDKYPDVDFEWKVHIKAEYSLSSLATTFSTFIGDSSATRVNSEDLEVLKYCKRLKALDLGHNNLYNLNFLKYTPDLEMLILACNHLTDISAIGELKHLKYLEIFTNKIVDLSPLANCTELLDLSIANTRVKSLKPLDQLPKLERLWAKDCSFLSKAEINRFKKAHPDCLVSFPGSKTHWSWRKHERYDHYRWCLKNNRWIPFDEPLPTQKKK